jgi:hypothetical protein
MEKTKKLTRAEIVRRLWREVRREMVTPKAGTVLEHRERGKIRAVCRVTDDGVQYRGRLYPSLGKAAEAAAKRLGQKSDHLSGPIYWGLKRRKRDKTGATHTVRVRVTQQAAVH